MKVRGVSVEMIPLSSPSDVAPLVEQTNDEIIFDDFKSKNPLPLANRGNTFVSLSGFLEILSKTELSSDKNVRISRLQDFANVSVCTFRPLVGETLRRIVGELSNKASSHRGRLLLTPCNAKRAEPCAQQAVRFVASRTAFFSFLSQSFQV